MGREKTNLASTTSTVRVGHLAGPTRDGLLELDVKLVLAALAVLSLCRSETRGNRKGVSFGF